MTTRLRPARARDVDELIEENKRAMRNYLLLKRKLKRQT